MNKPVTEDTPAGMNTLYDSDAFTVVHMQTSPDIDAADARQLVGRRHLALARHGFEIVDKRSGRHIYLDGGGAEVFQQKISNWQINTPTQEEVEDLLDNYSALAGNPVTLH